MAEFDKGAHFFSCDLQVHSPLDERWKGLGKGGDDQTKQYARELLTACRSVGLQAVAITDHHEMGFVSALRQAAADERDEEGKPLNKREQLIVFPGMEAHAWSAMSGFTDFRCRLSGRPILFSHECTYNCAGKFQTS